MGVAIAVAAFSGALVSELPSVSPKQLLGLFASLALVASILMLRSHDTIDEANEGLPVELEFNRSSAALLAGGIGFLAGMVGQSGAILTIPLLINWHRLPVRVATGTSLGITFSAALAGSAGKIFGGGTIIWTQILMLVIGSFAGSQIGGVLNSRLRVSFLRFGLAGLIFVSAVAMWFRVFS